eukprot:5424941-Prorocentrum_lima.AAC.1
MGVERSQWKASRLCMSETPSGTDTCEEKSRRACDVNPDATLPVWQPTAPRRNIRGTIIPSRRARRMERSKFQS